MFQLFPHNDLVLAAAAAHSDRLHPGPQCGLPRLRPLRPARVSSWLRARPLPPPLRPGCDPQLLRRSLLRGTGQGSLWSVLSDYHLCQVGSVNKGSCEGCEARCGMVFRPVCSGDQATVYANKCQAECAGVTDTTECQVNFTATGCTDV